jgi:Tfp pilus assembly PilM family ATPase
LRLEPLVLAGIRERLEPLVARIFPPRILLALEDDTFTLLALPGQGFSGGTSRLRRVPLPRGACVDGLPLQKAALGDLIGDLSLEMGLQGAQVVASLPRAACALRVVQWPFEAWPEEPEQALRQIDPDLSLAYPLSQAYLSLSPLLGLDSPLPLCSLLVTAPRPLVLAWIEVFAIAELHLERLQPAQAAELKAIEPLVAEAPADQLIGLLEWRTDGADLTLIRHGIPEFSRRLPVAPGDLVPALGQCLDFWRRRDPAVSRVRLLLVGSGSGLDGLADLLEGAGDWSLEIVDPLRRGWLPWEEASDDPLSPTDLDSISLLRLSGLSRMEPDQIAHAGMELNR